MWTLFWDMHSGGSTKLEPYEKIYIEADPEVARVVFYNRFGRNPERVTCTCCGSDYSIDSESTLEQLSGYHRNCAYEDKKYLEKQGDGNWSSPYLNLEDYGKREDVLIIRDFEIKPEEMSGKVPEEGYVWI